MSNITLVDTDILIDLGRDVPDAVNYTRDLNSSSGLAISTVTEMELLVGCANKVEQQRLDRFLQRFQIIKLDGSISDKAVELLRTYRLSHGLLIPDSLIAATAIVLNYPFVTKNQRDYRFISGLNLLSYP